MMDDKLARQAIIIEAKLANCQRLDPSERDHLFVSEAMALSKRLRASVKADGIHRAMDTLAIEVMAISKANAIKREALEDRIKKLEAVVATGNARPRERRQAPSRRIAG